MRANPIGIADGSRGAYSPFTRRFDVVASCTDGTLLGLLLLLVSGRGLTMEGSGVLRRRAVWAVDRTCTSEYEISTCITRSRIRMFA